MAAAIDPPLLPFETLLAWAEALDISRLPEDVAPVAVFDADETLWAADVGEKLFEAFVEQALVRLPAAEAVLDYLQRLNIQASSPADGLLDFLHAYRTGAFHTLEAYELMTVCFAGHTLEELESFSRACLLEFLPARLYPAMGKLIETLQSRGVDCHVISASPAWAVRVGGRLLGVRLEHIHGVELQQDAGSYSARLVVPVPMDVGKVSVLRAITTRRPVFAAGDSRFDLPMLRTALRSVLINPREGVLQALEVAPLAAVSRLELLPTDTRLKDEGRTRL